VDTMFFTTEYSRMKTLKKELGDISSFEQLTDEQQNNKFFMAKVTFPPYADEPAETEKDEAGEEEE
jgi:hypothetical protein